MTRMLSIVARIDNTPSISSSNPIAVGQFVQATIYGIEIPEIVVLPRTAVRDEGVWVVDTSMILYNRPVDVLRYENEFALNIMLFLYIIVECLIKEKKEKEELNIHFSCEKDECDTNLCISLNKCISFNALLEDYDLEFFIIKNILAKTLMTFESELSDTNTCIKITVDKENKL